MIAGDEVVCAVGDPAADADVVRTAGTLADSLGLRLALIHAADEAGALSLLGAAGAGGAVAGLSQAPLALGHLEALAADLGLDAVVRMYDGTPGAVLRGLGRALATAVLVVGDAGAPDSYAARLMGTWGCPLVVVPHGARPLLPRRPTTLACLVGDDGCADRSMALALPLGAALRGSFHLLHTGPQETPEAETYDVLERCWAAAEAHGIPVDTILGVGQWSRSMVATSRAAGADLIVAAAGIAPVDRAGPAPAAAVPDLIGHAREVIAIARPRMRRAG